MPDDSNIVLSDEQLYVTLQGQNIPDNSNMVTNDQQLYITNSIATPKLPCDSNLSMSFRSQSERTFSKINVIDTKSIDNCQDVSQTMKR